MQPSLETRRHEQTSSRYRWSTRFMVIGGVLSAVMGAAHFVLPLIYPWQEHVEDLYAPLHWALFATTVFFGVLLVLAGALTVLVAVAPSMPFRLVGVVAGGMATFWVIGAIYEILVPFPESEVARWALPAFSIIVAWLHITGLWLRATATRSRRE